MIKYLFDILYPYKMSTPYMEEYSELFFELSEEYQENLKNEYKCKGLQKFFESCVHHGCYRIAEWLYRECPFGKCELIITGDLIGFVIIWSNI